MWTDDTSIFLRRVLVADAVFSAGGALIMAGGAGVLAPVLGLPQPLLLDAGLALVPWVAVVGFVATRPQVPRAAVWALIAINLLWAIDSAALLLDGWVAPTALGEAFVIAQGLAVLLLAELEYLGLRRSRRLAVA